MTDNSQKIARRRETARFCTGSYLGNLPDHRGDQLQSPFVLNTTQGQVLPRREQRSTSTALPQTGVVLSPSIPASSTDTNPPLEQIQGKKKRVYKPKTPEQREAYNAKRLKSTEQR